MSATDLLMDLDHLGVRLEARGDRLRYFPRSAMTPELAERVKAHKPALLEILATGESPKLYKFTTHKQTAIVKSDTIKADDDDLAVAPWDDAIDAGDLDPCPKCGTLELWQSMLGNWRCQRCEPLAKGWGWANLVNAN